MLNLPLPIRAQHVHDAKRDVRARQRATETVSASGATASAWTDLRTVAAELVEGAADEAATTFGEAETVKRKFRIRWQPDIDVTTADRLTYAGEAYNIRDVLEIGWRDGLELRCERTQ